MIDVRSWIFFGLLLILPGCSLDFPAAIDGGCMNCDADSSDAEPHDASTDADGGSAVCGNGILESGEACDTNTSCGDLGLSGDALVDCFDDCMTVDTSTCWHCGDGVCSAAAGETPAACPVDCRPLSVGWNHSCRLDSTEVWCWGLNTLGALGNGGSTNSNVPVHVVELDNVVQVSAGTRHSCAVDDSGSVWCWGSNSNGQLGDDTTTNSPIPVAVQGIGDIIQVAAGRYHTCAVDNHGQVWCWGGNINGQLGNASNVDEHTPVEILEIEGVVHISVGHNHSCGIDDQGRLWCWGYNEYGQLGLGNTSDRFVPFVVTSLSGVVQVDESYSHTCAVTDQHQVWCWGRSSSGQLGQETTETYIDEPLLVPDLADIVQVSVGAYTTCALDDQGQVWCWGGNSHGQLGDGTLTSRWHPGVVLNLQAAVAVEVGDETACAEVFNGSVWCWGRNENGELGAGLTIDHSSDPVQVERW
ncbi:MAG: hypothetical protein J7M25_15640 [Deltaproteobacteria bacterium]|nr:hypothetical protein [Deltaproteobacteria bacterium]